jgi:hypothetical protein
VGAARGTWVSRRAERMAADYVAAISRAGVTKAAGGSPALLYEACLPLFKAICTYEETVAASGKAVKRSSKKLREHNKVLKAIAASPGPVPHGLVAFDRGEWETKLVPRKSPRTINGSGEGGHDASEWS